MRHVLALLWLTSATVMGICTLILQWQLVKLAMVLQSRLRLGVVVRLRLVVSI